jgi:hypothetical protein
MESFLTVSRCFLLVFVVRVVVDFSNGVRCSPFGIGGNLFLLPTLDSPRPLKGTWKFIVLVFYR